MTITAIGIVLTVIAVLLWAIMAALHRHTQVLINLQAQMQMLADQSAAPDAAEPVQASAPVARHRSTERSFGNVRTLTPTSPAEAMLL